jgi:hypothetical protein
VGAHAHPEPGDALAFAAGSFQGAAGHGLGFSARHPTRLGDGDQFGLISISQLPR